MRVKQKEWLKEDDGHVLLAKRECNAFGHFGHQVTIFLAINFVPLILLRRCIDGTPSNAVALRLQRPASSAHNADPPPQQVAHRSSMIH